MPFNFRSDRCAIYTLASAAAEEEQGFWFSEMKCKTRLQLQHTHNQHYAYTQQWKKSWRSQHYTARQTYVSNISATETSTSQWKFDL